MFTRDEELRQREVERVLAAIGWSRRQASTFERLRGLTNANYLVRSGDDALVVRITSPSTASAHDLDRRAECAALEAAQASDLCPPLLYYELPSGHMVTRYLPTASFESRSEVRRQPEVLRQIVRSVHCIHRLPAVDHRFDPFAKVRRTIARASAAEIDLPDGVERLVERAAAIEAACSSDPVAPCLCHNDLFSVNILPTRPIRFVDWEFVGMGDPLFDLATLVVAWGENVPLCDDMQTILLEAYFGEVEETTRARLADAVFTVRLHAALWGLIQHLDGASPPEGAGFTYDSYAREVLSALIAEG